MKTLKVLRNHKGFSALEISVTTTILAGITAVGVGSFQNQISHTKRNEAKVNLSAIFAAEKNFFVEFKTYYTNLQVIGFSPTGRQSYNVGFTLASADHPGATDLATINGFGNSRALAGFAANSMITLADLCNPALNPTTSCSMSNFSQQPLSQASAAESFTADRDEFSVAAVSTHTRGNIDSLSINDSGVMRILRDGTMP
jgi:type IV pilus assembly protein PilA